MVEPSRSLTRKQFDEVIRRAAELAAHEPDGQETSLTEADLFRIGQEVGLAEKYVRRALMDVRSSLPTARGPVSALYGPPSVVASRVVPGDRRELADKIDEFMVAGQLLQSLRKGGSVLQYRPAVDWASQIARAASSTTRKYYVAAAKRVEVRLETLDEEKTLVELEVEPGTRDDYLAGGVIGGLVGGSALGVGVTLALAATAPLALGIGVGAAVGSALFGGICVVTGTYHKKRLLEVRSEIEGILDRLEAEESLEPPPPSWRRWVRRHFHGVARELMGDD